MLQICFAFSKIELPWMGSLRETHLLQWGAAISSSPSYEAKRGLILKSAISFVIRLFNHSTFSQISFDKEGSTLIVRKGDLFSSDQLS